MPYQDQTQVSIQMDPRRGLALALVSEAVAEAEGQPDAQTVADMLMATMIVAKLVGVEFESFSTMIDAGVSNAGRAADFITTEINDID